MYVWIIKRPNIAYLGSISVALCVEEISVESSVKEISCVANFQSYVDSHLIGSYISASKTIIVKHKIKQNHIKHKRGNVY